LMKRVVEVALEETPSANAEAVMGGHASATLAK